MNSEYKLIETVLNEFLISKYISLNHKKIIKSIKKKILLKLKQNKNLKKNYI